MIETRLPPLLHSESEDSTSLHTWLLKDEESNEVLESQAEIDDLAKRVFETLDHAYNILTETLNSKKPLGYRRVGFDSFHILIPGANSLFCRLNSKEISNKKKVYVSHSDMKYTYTVSKKIAASRLEKSWQACL